jgi:hypothetical protein
MVAVVPVVVRVADGDFLGGGQGAEDVDATNCAASYPDVALICLGSMI